MKDETKVETTVETNDTDNTLESPKRRDVLKKGSAAVAGATAMTGGFPMIWAQKLKDVKLRQFGTGVSNINEIAKKCKEDLGFELEMTALDTDTTAQRIATQPKTFDIADIEYFTLKKVWGSGNLQPMLHHGSYYL